MSTALATVRLHLADEVATADLGARLAAAIEAEHDAIRARGLIIGLTGDLGAGKTALVRAMLRALGEIGPVKSPTYALLEPYVVSSLDFHHFDFYRLTDAAEFDAAGFREWFRPGAICAVEWPERAMGRLPTQDLSIALNVAEVGRNAVLSANTEMGARCLSHAIETGSKPETRRGGA